MNAERRKELMTEFKNRHPEMGVIAIGCPATGDKFLAVCRDTRVGFNRHRFQLPARMHPNKRLQALWDTYGESGLTFTVERVLKYDDPAQDHTDELEKLLNACLAADPKAQRL